MVGAVLLFGVGYAGGRALDADRIWAGDEASKATPPAEDATPEPGATPDTSEPFWYVPYENAEREKPDFSGELNGITVGVEDGPLPSCDSQHLTGELAIDAVAGTDIAFELQGLPGELSVMPESAEAMLCDDGPPRWFAVEFTAGEGAAVRITRMREVTWWREWGSEERWSTGTVANHDAVFKDQLVTGKLGDAAVIVLDPEIAGSTRIKSRSPQWTLEFITAVAEEMYR
jgi:hypothetical protein